MIVIIYKPCLDVARSIGLEVPDVGGVDSG